MQMMQVIVHAYDESEGRPVPAYAVCRTGRAFYAEAMRPGWTDTAHRVADSLNARCPRAASDAAAGLGAVHLDGGPAEV
jgi:hypothetical protein